MRRKSSTDPRVSYNSLRTAWSVLFEFLNPIQRRKHRANHLDDYICVRRSDRERTTARGERLQQRGGRAGHDREGEERTQVGSAEFYSAASTGGSLQRESGISCARNRYQPQHPRRGGRDGLRGGWSGSPHHRRQTEGRTAYGMTKTAP